MSPDATGTPATGTATTMATATAPTTTIASAMATETRFVTGEAVHLDLRVARLGSRMVARATDLIVQVALAALLFQAAFMLLAIGDAFVPVDGAVAAGVMVLLAVVVLVGYPAGCETWWRGRTLGKMLMGLRVVRDDGGPITFRHALARALVGVAADWPGLLLGPVSWLICLCTMMVSPAGKRPGDYAAGTVVIHDRTPAAWGWAPAMPPGLAPWAANLDLAGLDDDLALAVRHYLARNRQLREPARTRLGYALAREVAAVTSPPAPAGTPGWAFLAAVHAERHRRAMLQLAAVRERARLAWPVPE